MHYTAITSYITYNTVFHMKTYFKFECKSYIIKTCITKSGLRSSSTQGESETKSEQQFIGCMAY